MISTIIVLMLIVAVFLIIVILIQNPKGGGMSSEFGGTTNQMFGVQKTGDVLEKLSWGFFTFILVAALSTVIISKLTTNTVGTVESAVNVESAISTPAPSAATGTLPSGVQTAPAGASQAAPVSAPAGAQTAPATTPTATTVPAQKK